MGAKASTASGGQQSPRARTFSTSSSSDVVSGGTQGFNLLRSIPGMHVTNDRQRARSLSSVPDLQANHNNHESISIPASGSTGPPYDVVTSASPETDSSSNDENPSSAGAQLALGRVYTATSLPSHIWSLNGEFFILYLFFKRKHCILLKQ